MLRPFFKELIFTVVGNCKVLAFLELGESVSLLPLNVNVVRLTAKSTKDKRICEEISPMKYCLKTKRGLEVES